MRGLLPAQRKQLFELARAHTEEALGVLVNIIHDEYADNGHRIQAIKELFNRAEGQAPSHAIIEQRIKTAHAIDLSHIRQLPSDELEALENLIAKVIDRPMLDVTPNESPDHALSGRRTGESGDDGG